MNKLTPSQTSRRGLIPLLSAPILALILAGCAPAAPTSPSPDGGGGQPSSASERDAYDLKLAECLRSQGLDVKDPLPGKGIVEDTPEIREAFPACSAEIGDPPAQWSGQLSQDDLDKLLERAKCLREKGYEIQEPTATDPGFIPAEVSEADYESCAF